jgi:hypothetical protein
VALAVLLTGLEIVATLVMLRMVWRILIRVATRLRRARLMQEA